MTAQVEYTLDQISAGTFLQMATALWGLKNDGSKKLQLIESIDGAMRVNVSGEPLAMRQMRSAVCDAAGDRPADITNNANVTAAMYKWDLTSAGLTTVKKALLTYRASRDAANAVAIAGPICEGFIFTINPDDATQAATRLTQTDFAAGSTATTYAADTYIVDANDPVQAIIMPEGYYITSIYAVAIPAGFTPTNITPARLELKVYG